MTNTGNPSVPNSQSPDPHGSGPGGWSHQSPPNGPPGPPLGQTFFDRQRSRPLRRPAQAPIGGVCAAVADRYGIDRVLVRGLTIILFLTVFPVALTGYGLGWLLLPDENGVILGENAARGRWSWRVAGALLVSVVGVGALAAWLDSGWLGSVTGMALVVLVAFGVAMLFSRRDRRPAQPAATHPGPVPQAPPTGPPASSHGAPATAPLQWAHDSDPSVTGTPGRTALPGPSLEK